MHKFIISALIFSSVLIANGQSYAENPPDGMVFIPGGTFLMGSNFHPTG